MKAFLQIIASCQLFVALALTASAQQEPLLTIGGIPVFKEEFVSLYKKSNQGFVDDSLKTSPREYLDLFINYKLKVIEAEKRGMDTLASFRNEFNQYREQLARQFMNFSEVTEDDMQEAYRRMCTELNAAHILLGMPPHASREQDSASYRRCMQLRQEIVNGANFEDLANQYSDDPSASSNHGHLGYFSGGQMVPEFEDAAFKLNPGELSMPVRTKFGYHLIYLIDKRPNPGQIQVAHIMKRATSPHEITKATNLLDSLKQRAEAGDDFATLAQRYSDDEKSASRGGLLPYFSSSQIDPAFAAASYALMKDGDVSEPIQTRYGVHLIKRIHLKPVPPYPEVKDLIAEKLRRNTAFSQQKRELFIARLKKEHSITENTNIRQKLFEKTVSGNDEWLFKIDSISFPATDFTTAWNKHRSARQHTANVNDFYNNYLEEKLIETEQQQLEVLNPDFRSLLQEYHDGILLFNLMEDEIWRKARLDSVGLEDFYEQNPELFRWGNRFKGWAIKCDNQEVKDFIDLIFEQAPEISKEELTDLLNLNFKDQASIQKGIFAGGQNELIDYLVWNKSRPETYHDGLDFVRGDLTPPTPKTLDEARGQYVDAYQNEQEQKWIAELRREYKVKVNKKLLKTIESLK
ncbi:peptidylprolyl isomerase [Mangrovibacterium marinum]|uniref:Peptidyl-prolyl cis-trans isomerase SurA n=1 Tax=Mangrovibacterium marinum TaxID=1639118 RepID=A0A2T5BY74_9BACT|nr:peptidylprolyl isomerase [Mangrovibacterium marinum]PTN06346.1 peptidyl-prolyl cis-trans isomerase SurA [Mangrovibacterium marinum]